ncbi:MAG: acyl-CoA reductase-like NAD-dependent aldehyde dehydrogenase [Verrucomicrobiales bacterium]|jgi:acyl-CoA reductase-like NAD-dependent aldehyde dehydrogenase
MKRYEMLIDGEWVAGEHWFESFDPATGEPWAKIAAGTAADVDRAVRAAHSAMSSGPWARMTAYERGRAIERLASILRDRASILAEVETRDTGKLIRETTGSCAYVPSFYEYYAGLADKIGGRTLPIDKANMHVYTVREPVGVVAAIVPWNSPQMLLAVKLAPALAAGNSVVIKPSEHASVPVLEFARLAEEAGLPPGVINVVTGGGDPVGHALTTHPLVRRIAFTGGPDTARAIVRNSAENFAHVSLELGGKSPQIVFQDANTQSAVNGIVGGIFGASGQSCVAGSRLYVHDDVYDDVVGGIIDMGARIRIGDPLDPDSEMGPLATLAQIAKYDEYVGSAESEGGEVLSGGGHLERPGWFVEPTVVACSNDNVRVAAEEIFGPVLSVMRFADEDDVITAANNSRFGLAAGVWTRDVARVHRVTEALDSGIVWVNMYRATSPVAPFGGTGDSGSGRESGEDAIYDYTKTKTVWINTSDEPTADPFRVG